MGKKSSNASQSSVAVKAWKTIYFDDLMMMIADKGKPFWGCTQFGENKLTTLMLEM